MAGKPDETNPYDIVNRLKFGGELVDETLVALVESRPDEMSLMLQVEVERGINCEMTPEEVEHNVSVVADLNRAFEVAEERRCAGIVPPWAAKSPRDPLAQV